MMDLTGDRQIDLKRLYQAMDALEAAGYALWLMVEGPEEGRVEQLQVAFDAFPDNLPIAAAEVLLLESLFKKVWMLESAAQKNPGGEKC